MSFALVYAKSQETGFRNRLAVALTEQCRWTLQRAQLGGESTNRWAARQDLARVVRTQVTSQDALTRIALYVLLPWGLIDPDNDTALQTRVASVFDELASAALPA